MNLRDLIEQTRYVAETAGGQSVAIIGKGLLIFGFGKTVDDWQADYQEYLIRQMVQLAEMKQEKQRPHDVVASATRPAERRVRVVDF